MFDASGVMVALPLRSIRPPETVVFAVMVLFVKAPSGVKVGPCSSVRTAARVGLAKASRPSASALSGSRVFLIMIILVGGWFSCCRRLLLEFVANGGAGRGFSVKLM